MLTVHMNVHMFIDCLYSGHFLHNDELKHCASSTIKRIIRLTCIKRIIVYFMNVAMVNMTDLKKIQILRDSTLSRNMIILPECVLAGECQH